VSRASTRRLGEPRAQATDGRAPAPSAVSVAAYDRTVLNSPPVNLSATIPPVNDRVNADMRGAMSTLPSWVQYSIIAVGVLLSPAFAFLMALIVAGFVSPIRRGEGRLSTQFGRFAVRPARSVNGQDPSSRSTGCFGVSAETPRGVESMIKRKPFQRGSASTKRRPPYCARGVLFPARPAGTRSPWPTIPLLRL
jgi:hypothetical protein